MKTIAFIRLSKDSNQVEQQRATVIDFAGKKGFAIDAFCECDLPSRRSKPAGREHPLLEQVESQDTLIVSQLSQLGRSTGEIIRLVDYLIQKEIRFIAVEEGIQLSGNKDAQSKVIMSMFSLFAHVERTLISTRTREALAAARAAGKALGRPKGSLGKSKLDGREQEIAELLALDVSKASIAKTMEVDRTTLVHFIKTRALTPAPGRA